MEENLQFCRPSTICTILPENACALASTCVSRARFSRHVYVHGSRKRPDGSAISGHAQIRHFPNVRLLGLFLQSEEILGIVAATLCFSVRAASSMVDGYDNVPQTLDGGLAEHGAAAHGRRGTVRPCSVRFFCKHSAQVIN